MILKLEVLLALALERKALNYLEVVLLLVPYRQLTTSFPQMKLSAFGIIQEIFGNHLPLGPKAFLVKCNSLVSRVFYYPNQN